MNLLRVILKRLGIAIYPYRRDYHYVPNYYGAGAAKSIDIRRLEPFGELAGHVINQGRTLLYYDRLYTIYQALFQISRLPDFDSSSLTEIGVYKGGCSYFIALTLNFLRVNNALYCFDTFEGHDSQDVKAKDIYQKPSFFRDTSYESVSAYLSAFDNIRVYKGRFQQTSGIIDKKTLSFAHLDMDLYEPTLYALNFVDDRLLKGGIILVDDYGFWTCPGIKEAVDQFKSSNKKYFGMHLLTGQYLMVKNLDG